MRQLTPLRDGSAGATRDTIGHALAAIGAGQARPWDYHRGCRIALLDSSYMQAAYEEPDPCLQRARIYHGQQLLLETPRGGGSWRSHGLAATT